MSVYCSRVFLFVLQSLLNQQCVNLKVFKVNFSLNVCRLSFLKFLYLDSILPTVIRDYWHYMPASTQTVVAYSKERHPPPSKNANN